MDTDIEIKMEIDDEMIENFVTASMISHDTMVTCGECKETMNFEDYNAKHRSLHYNLCWLDGIEDEIDFTDISKVSSILRKSLKNNKAKIRFKCHRCNGIKYSISGFAKHIEQCENNPVCDTVLEESRMVESFDAQEDDYCVVCGRCGECLTYAEYQNEHRKKHYNLCWLDGEKELDYEDVNNIASLLRKCLPKGAELEKKVSFTCEWCNDIKRSVVGFSRHLKTCSANPKKIADLLENPVKEELIVPVDIDFPDGLVTCGLCQKSMLLSEYEKTHRLTHNYLCWLNDDEKPDFNDESLITRLLRKSLPSNAARKKAVNFVCEWCKKQNKSVVGFASHIKQCKFKPDTILCLLNETDRTNNSNKKIPREVTNVTNLKSTVTCGRCFSEMSLKEYYNEHCSKHYNLCWIEGEDELDFESYDTVLRKVKECIPFKEIRNRKVNLTCEKCKTVKKSVSGFASHVMFCHVNSDNPSALLTKCKDCGNKVKPSSMASHKLKTCKGLLENCDDTFYDRSYFNQNNRSFQTLRRKKRLPNVLTFHPDNNHASDYRDCTCKLCDYIAPSVNDIFNHILNVHSIDIKNYVGKLFNLNDWTLTDTHDLHKNIYIKPLLNYYNFSKKHFWTANYHENFLTNVELLNNNEALKYLPSIQESCKIFNSDNEEITVALFKSTPVNDMHWLFTGGPIWAMSWCPVPEDVQTQYLAISCHRKPDLEHKELSTYKYPSLVQLWDFKSLNNINCESICDVPYMSYGLAHEFGAVWDMEWCPSGAYEPKKKIGLLALSTSSGDCPVFAMPHVTGDSEMFYVYKAKPVIARNFQCELTELGVQCTKVCWKAVSPFNTLICGYSNGMVSVFVINFKSMFFNDDVLYPSHTFRASKCSITGLSVNHFNSSILASTSTDGNVTLWDLSSTEDPIFQKKFLCPSDCAWLQQCYTLTFCTKGVNPNTAKKVRTINFFNCDDDVCEYNPELHVIKKIANSTKVVSYYNVTKNGEKLNCENSSKTVDKKKINTNNVSTGRKDSNDLSDENNKTVDKKKKNANNVSTGRKDSNDLSDDETSNPGESTKNSDEEKCDNSKEDPSKNFDDDDWYGHSFFQRCVHWSISGSNWMNVVATGDESGVVYEKLFLPGINQFKKENSSTLELMVKKLLSNNTPNDSHGYSFTNTAKEFGLRSRIVPPEEEIEIQKDQLDVDKPLLRYPLASISRVAWNQNLNSFRWLAIGTQGGFALVSPSQTLPDSSIQLFYKIISSPN